MKPDNLRIHCLIHVSVEGIGHIESWAKKHQHHLSYTRLYEEVQFPTLDEFDWLIVMGGPMNIYQIDIYPWLVAEKRFIKSSIESGKTVIGFCLGSQLIASVLGARITRNGVKEIGWFPILLSESGRKSSLFQEEDITFPVFHWHGDTFSIPPNCMRLASSKGCLNQAFLYKERVLGFQFHLEVTPDSLNEMLRNGKSELREGKYIQQAYEIESNRDAISQCNLLLESILDRLADK